MNTSPMSCWAQNRAPIFADSPNLDSLFEAWDFSRVCINRLRQQLTGVNMPRGCSVAISGSLSRMEAHAASDLDVLVIVDDIANPGIDASGLHQEAWNAIETANVGLSTPKASGIFSEPALLSLLTDPQVRGIVDEDVTPFGQRMQLLLDAQPICNDDAFQNVLRQLAEWYSETTVSSLFGEPNCFQWFREDVLRYWHSIRARAYWAATSDADRLALNLKYRSSRAAIIAATLISIEECTNHSTTSEQQYRLLSELRRTPCERIWSAADGRCGDTFLQAYQNLWNTVRRGANQLDSDVLKSVDSIRACLRHLAGI